jgi:hypothetical protein
MEFWVTGYNFESWPFKDHSCHVCFKLTNWFQRRRLLNIFSIGSYVKIKSSHGSHLEFPISKWFTSFLQSHNSIGLVVSNKKIFKISINQNTLCALAVMLDFRSAPKTKIVYMTIQWTFLPNLVEICFVVAEKKMKIWNSHRVQC